MIKSITKRVKKKTRISAKEAQEIADQALMASEILEDERFAFLREYFQSALDYAEECILNNTIREVDEVHTISDRLVKIFKTPKKVQVDELAGQYKFINKFFTDMKKLIKLKEELDEEVANDRVILNEESK